MSRRIASARRTDAAIVGGGIVGAACALALAREGLQVTLIERAEPAPWSADTPDLRVYAFAPDNAALLDALGVWDAVAAASCTRMRRYGCARAAATASHTPSASSSAALSGAKA